MKTQITAKQYKKVIKILKDQLKTCRTDFWMLKTGRWDGNAEACGMSIDMIDDSLINAKKEITKN